MKKQFAQNELTNASRHTEIIRKELTEIIDSVCTNKLNWLVRKSMPRDIILLRVGSAPFGHLIRSMVYSECKEYEY